MATYEVLYVFKPVIDAEGSEGALAAAEKVLKASGGKVVRSDKQGRKRLAYEINKFKDGFIVASVVEMDADAVEKFRKACHLNEDILRVTIVRLDEVALAAVTNPRPREERPERGGDRGDRGGRPGGRPGGFGGGRGGGGGRFRDREDRR